MTSLGVPVPVSTGDADRLYRWWYGPNATPAALAAPAIIPPIEQLFTGVQLAGPDLTPYTFTTGLFRAPPAGGGPTSSLDAYGYQGAAPRPSYSSPADYTFLWYDAAAKGPDEEGVEGTGLMRYVNGGVRYKSGTVPSGPVPMFTMAGSVTSAGTPPDRHLRTRPGRVRPRRRPPAEPNRGRLTAPATKGAHGLVLAQARTPGSGISSRRRSLMLGGRRHGTSGPGCERRPMIVTRGLTKRYGETLAVDNLSFTVSSGVVTGFLGPNGSGKSAAIHMILGLDRPDAGSALVNGYALRRVVVAVARGRGA